MVSFRQVETCIQRYHLGDRDISLVVPDAFWLRENWQQHFPEFPFWGKCWPSAIALAGFIIENPRLVQDQRVLELAGGLGLPSLTAGLFAGHVTCSDYVSHPLSLVERSAILNKLTRISTTIIDWNHLPESIEADVILLSDVNYQPQTFESLSKMLQRLLTEGKRIILSTPQRIMAKPFIEQWSSFIQQQDEVYIADGTGHTWVSIYVLHH